jgi:pimeloyl-ACP methyl ester carboxylesterase
MPSIDLPDASLHFEQQGTGSPLLLVAGLASDSMSWLTVWNELGSRYRVVAPDNRGVGRTRPQDGPASIDAMADDCAALLAHLKIGRAAVVGHSMGGFVAQRLALRHPRLVERLVLVATGARPSPADVALFRDLADRQDAGEDPARWFRRLFDVVFTPRFLADPANVDAATRWALDYPYPQSPSAFRRQVEAIAAFDGTAGLAQIAAQTLVLAGREDVLFPLDGMQAFASRIAGARFEAIDGAAHAVHTEQPRVFVDAIARFVPASAPGR